MTARKTQEQVIDEFKEVHGNKYDYSKVVYKDTHTKVCIICHEKDEDGNEHGEFWQTPKDHSNGQGCKKCGVLSRVSKRTLSIEYFINKSQEIHNNKYNYSKVKYKNSRTKVKIICPIHGEFEISPHSHLQGQGCKKCGVKQSSKTRKNNSKQELEKLLKNTPWKLIEYIGTHNSKGYCQKHGKELKLNKNHIKQGFQPCLDCFFEKYKLVNEDLKKIQLKYPHWLIKKTKKFNSHTYFKCFCTKHQKEFNLCVKTFPKYSGCQYCMKRMKIYIGKNELINIINEKYNNELEFIDKIGYKIICRIVKWNVKRVFHDGNEFREGKVNIYSAINTETFIAKCMVDFNSELDYTKTIYKKSNNNIIYTCKKHGDIIQKACIHLSAKAKCPKCNTSRMENMFRNYLNEKMLFFEEQKSFENLKYKGNLRFDFYIPLLNICIELDGEQHFKFVPVFHKSINYFTECKKRDAIKEQYCKDNNITLIRISYKDFDKIYKSVIDNMLNMLHNK